eukprot:scaffold74653_cov56-Attheya_sp.AAC.1
MEISDSKKSDQGSNRKNKPGRLRTSISKFIKSTRLKTVASSITHRESYRERSREKITKTHSAAAAK